MRIGIDARVLQGERRGQWRYAWCLIDALLKSDTRNSYVLFYHGFRRQEFVFEPRANLEQVWCHVPGQLVKPLWEYCNWPPVELLLRRKIDVFHNLLNFNRVFLTPVPSKCPMVATYHGIADPKTLFDSFGYTLEDTKRWLNRLASDASIVIAISELVRDNLLEYVSFPQEKIRVVYSGVEERFLRPVDGGEKLRRLGLEGKRFFFYVGGMEQNKNLKRLLEAFSSLGMEDTWLAIAGEISAARKSELEAIAKSRVLFTGRISDDELMVFYRECLAYVLPTIYEGFGLPVLEAMACGAAVIVSKYTGIAEKVGEYVMQFDPLDTGQLLACLRRLSEDEPFRQSMKKRGPQKAAEFTWEKTAQQVIAVYEACA